MHASDGESPANPATIPQANAEPIPTALPVQKAAQAIASLDVGVLSVGAKDHLIGMITELPIATSRLAVLPKGKVRKPKCETL